MLSADKHRILACLQGQRMLLRPATADSWTRMCGVFQVPEGTAFIRFFLNQALAKGALHSGSAVRFDDLALYLFRTEAEARSFAGAL